MWPGGTVVHIAGRSVTYPPGVFVPIFDASAQPSGDYTRLVDKQGTLTYMGRFNTTSKSTNKFHDDPHFKLFAKSRNIKLPSEYGLAQLNAEAVYTEVNKYGGPDLPLGDNLKAALTRAINTVIDMVRPHIRVDRVLTADEVIAKIDTTRSPGFPWNKNYTSFADCYASHSEYVNYFTNAVANGEDPLTFWNYFPKEEILPEEKIRVGRVRQISGCAMEMRMLGNQLFLEQNEKMTLNYDKLWSKVGISPMQQGWDRLYRRLAARSKHGFALDISRFDANYQSWLAAGVMHVRLECMSASMRTPEVERQVRFFYSNTFQGLGVLPHGEVISKTHGNNSGSPNTTYDNTLGNMIAFLTVWYLACEDAGTELDPLEHLEAAIYGDDNTCTVTAEGQAVLTVPRIVAGFRCFGWGVTFEIGNGYVPLHTMVFLSYKFTGVKCDGRTIIVPVPRDGRKALASLAYKGKNDPALSYTRACGLLVVYWWDREVRNVLDAYLNNLEDVYFNTPQAAQLRKQRLTAAAIDALYLGNGS